MAPAHNQKGIVTPLLLILLILSVVIPVTYFAMPRNSVLGSRTGDVSSIQEDRPGFLVAIDSGSKTWNMVEYLCESLTACTYSLDSGKRFGSVSGGSSEGSRVHETTVYKDSSWEGYKYLKVYVTDGLGLQKGSTFKINNTGVVPGASVECLGNTNNCSEILIIPLESISSFYKTPIIFALE